MTRSNKHHRGGGTRAVMGGVPREGGATLVLVSCWAPWALRPRVGAAAALAAFLPLSKPSCGQVQGCVVLVVLLQISIKLA